MIISASRRTDIPAYYSEWFFRRLREGCFCVRNPVSPRRVSRLSVSPETVDGIVFWTKNPIPMLSRLSELEPYPYYIQFTLTGYGRDIEPGLPDKRGALIPAFQRLAEQAGAERVVWRYDPILISGRYSAEYHMRAFGEIARSLRGCTRRVVISFVDVYAKNRRALQALEAAAPDDGQIRTLAAAMSAAAAENGMQIFTCAEQADLSAYRVRHGSCVDRELLGRLNGCRLKEKRDRNQRGACGCMESVDIGAYDTCPGGCRYCYAVRSRACADRNRAQYDPASPLLCSALTAQDQVSERSVETLRLPDGCAQLRKGRELRQRMWSGACRFPQKSDC